MDLNCNLKILNSMVNKELKNISKTYLYKKKRNVLYKLIDNYLSCNTYSCSRLKEGMNIIIYTDIKPFWFDDELWNVMEMPENSDEPVSLRFEGAFSFVGLPLFYKQICVDSIINEDIIYKYINDFATESDFAISDFIHSLEISKKEFAYYVEEDFKGICGEHLSDVKYGAYDVALGKMLTLIHCGKYLEAIDIAKMELISGRKGNLGINKKNIYELVIEYCSKLTS